MTARHRLNSAYLNGAICVAGLVAAMAQSGTVFLVLLVLLTVSSVAAGEIRLGSGRKRRR